MSPEAPEFLRRANQASSLRILFVQHCPNFTGSAISGKIVAAGFRKAGWDVDVVFGFDGPQCANYAALGCHVHQIPHKSWLRGGGAVQSARRIFSEWRASRPLIDLCRRIRPDVVYLNTLVSLAGAVAARHEQIPCVWHIRELFNDVGGEMVVPACGGRWLVRRLLNRLAIRRVAISRAVAENVLGTTADPGLDIIPNAVPPEFFLLDDDVAKCRARLSLPADQLILGVPGTLRPMKGHPFFFRSAARILDRFPQCVLAVTGTGEQEYERSLRQQVAELGLAERTLFLGNVTDMPRFYRACDLVCVPSVAEPFGRTVIEAFASGTPVVATAVGGMQETIQPNRTGLLAPYGDEAELARILGEMLGNPSLRRQLAVAARQEAVENYEEASHQRRICDVVLRALGRTEPGTNVPLQTGPFAN